MDWGYIMDKVSIIVPCYNEEATIKLFYDSINMVMKEMPNQCFEMLFIDDGSRDGTLEIITNLHKQDARIRFISFSRNFGKEAGLYAGLEHATGDYIAVMDADLQDPPALIKDMYALLSAGDYDCIATRRATRKGEPPIRTIFSKIFYKLINAVSHTPVVDGARDYRMMSRKMANAILALGEKGRFSKGIFSWVGFNTKWLTYENIERSAGETKWSFRSLFAYAMDGVIAFSTVPLIISSAIGILFFVISFIMILIIIVKTLLLGDPVPGYPSLVCIIFFVVGVQLFCVGIIGQYLAKVFLEVKNRPIYITKTTEKDIDV